ncbi:MAG: recombinase family protein [Alphaproteobacteria bacterium]|nr:recombinase family protein [Alphaproteobacteria bacterium]
MLFEHANKMPVKAAAYVRMSTEHQKYSPQNQMASISEYASKYGYEIIKTYADEGKSGLNIAGRAQLQQMIKDVENKTAEFKAILVLDITRWGRFQDADESAYYEYICKRAGIKVQYCAEQFENDGSPVSTIIKGVKRTMAAEYSRELSCKVFAGQSRLITMGYKQGGYAGYGLRRMLIDENGNHKSELSIGQHKSLQTDRVILVPGAEEEQKIVRWMYKVFIEEGMNESQIAENLNRRGIKTDLDREWTRGTVHQVLTNEKYIGNNVFNRISYKLKIKRVKNPEDMWVRADGVFEAIIDPGTFYIAKGIITARSRKISDEEMLNKLKELHNKIGFLSAIVIDEAENMPSSSAYGGRFGGLLRAYQLVGYTPDRDYRYVEINKVLRELHGNSIQETIDNIINIGGEVTFNDDKSLLIINDMFSVSIVICRCTLTSANAYRWKVRFDTSLNPDITIAVRMCSNNDDILDYYLLPSIDFQTPKLKLEENNKDLLDSYRFDNLDYLFEMARCISIMEAA